MVADQSITALWTELQELLSEKVKDYGRIQKKPPTIKEIQDIEEKMGLSFPSDLKEWYSCSNGEKVDGGISVLGFPFLPLDEMYRQWKIWDDMREEWNEEEGHTSFPNGYIKKMYINRGWIPFSDDGGGNHIGMDLDPDEKGTYGQIINFGRDENDKFIITTCLKDFLQLIIDIYKKTGLSFVEEEEDCFIPYLGDEPIHAIDFFKARIIPN